MFAAGTESPPMESKRDSAVPALYLPDAKITKQAILICISASPNKSNRRETGSCQSMSY